MASRWFYQVFGQEMGPVGFEVLVEMVRTGTLTDDDRVRRELSEDWMAARDVIGLSRAAKLKTVDASAPEPDAATSCPEKVRSLEHSAVTEPKRRRWGIPLGRLRTWLVAAAVLALVTIGGYESWTRRRPPMFPKSGARGPQPGDSEWLAAVRRPHPKVPSIPDLEEGMAKLIPGLEASEPAYSPCLSPDLKTIVYAAMRDTRYGYDLYIATRENASKAFGPSKLIHACQSPDAELSPTLSPDGLELIFVRSDQRPQFFHAMREVASGEFGSPELWKVPNYDPDKKQRVERPQFLDPLHVMFCLVEMESNVRRMMVAQRSLPKSPFGSLQNVKFSNAWPPWFVSTDGSRAYYGTEEGLFITARSSPSKVFGESIRILAPKNTGPFDGPIWVAPQEDVVFYVSSGPGKKKGIGPAEGRRLWMMRF